MWSGQSQAVPGQTGGGRDTVKLGLARGADEGSVGDVLGEVTAAKARVQAENSKTKGRGRVGDGGSWELWAAA